MKRRRPEMPGSKNKNSHWRVHYRNNNRSAHIIDPHTDHLQPKIKPTNVHDNHFHIRHHQPHPIQPLHESYDQINPGKKIPQPVDT